MNHILILCMSALMGFTGNCPMPVSAAETVDVNISYQVLNTLKGYSYDARLDIYLDGKSFGQGSVLNQEVPNAVTVKVPKGLHTIKVVLLANYKDAWEERTIANDYSNDFVWVKTADFQSKMKVKLYFDINTGTHVGKKPKKAKS